MAQAFDATGNRTQLAATTGTGDDFVNRTMSGYSTGADNRLLSDGVYDYAYDAEGNRTRRTEIATGAVDEYTWDHRNRLTKIVKGNSRGSVLGISTHARFRDSAASVSFLPLTSETVLPSP